MNILLVGVGNLGIRYLEGLMMLEAKSYKIFIYDENTSTIKNLNKTLNINKKNIYLYEKINNLKNKNFDLCILATTAKTRHILIKKINEKFKIKIWLLEKLVSNKVRNLEKIYKTLKNSKVYVNLPRCYSKIYQLLKKQNLKKIYIKIKGGKWNIGSNSLHHLYLLEWLTSDKIIKVKVFKKQLYATKRKNYFDFYGNIIGYSYAGSKIDIINLKNSKKFIIEIFSGKNRWLINEHLGYLKKNDRFIIRNNFNFQSKITPTIVKTIKKSKLPLLNDIYHLHKKILIEYNKFDFNEVT